MEESPSIRTAHASDGEKLAQFAERVFDEAFRSQVDAGDMAAYLADAFGPDIQRAEIMAPGSILLIAEAPSETQPSIMGYVHLAQSNTPDCVDGPAPLELKRLYVDATYQGRGVGTRLLDAALDRARAAGAETIWLGVWEHNPRAQAFYARAGFTRVGEHSFVMGSDHQTDWVLTREL